eukprot:6218048-Amphidinium_carterae.1
MPRHDQRLRTWPVATERPVHALVLTVDIVEPPGNDQKGDLTQSVGKGRRRKTCTSDSHPE